MNSNNLVLVDPTEQDTIARVLRVWLNGYEDKPSKFRFEYLSDSEGIAMSTLQNAYYTKRFIDGGYEAKYEFRIIYRCAPSDDDERLKADEMLNSLGRWIMTTTPPTLADNIRIVKFERNVAALYARYENGVEDHIINLKMIYEVNV